MIFTSLTALYDLGFIKYKPARIFIELPLNTNTTNYSKKYSIAVQSKDTINIGVITFNDKLYYCPERLFIEIDKFPLENTIKAAALKNLEPVLNAQKVFDIYQKLKNKRRKINKERIALYLNKNLLLMEKILANETVDKVKVLNEYIIALLAKKDYPTSITKDRSSVEVFIDSNSLRHDTNDHVDSINKNPLIKTLENQQEIIYFNINIQKEINLDKNKIISLELKAKSRKHKLNDLLSPLNTIVLSLNTTYTDQELKAFINEYAITKTNLKTIKNALGLVFTREMILAEKYQTLITQNKNCTRTKDLIDLVNIYHEDIDFKKFVSWLFRKWSRKRNNPLNLNEVLVFIKDNMDIELTKIKANFLDATKMYNPKLTYEEAINVYKEISHKILSSNQKV